jgi:hypothetical protein
LWLRLTKSLSGPRQFIDCHQFCTVLFVLRPTATNKGKTIRYLLTWKYLKQKCANALKQVQSATSRHQELPNPGRFQDQGKTWMKENASSIETKVVKAHALLEPISGSTDGGPTSRVCPRETICSAPHRH